MGAWHKRQLAIFTVQLKNGETIQVSVEELEEFLEKNRDAEGGSLRDLRIELQYKQMKKRRTAPISFSQ
jgi:hypothetical protein